MRSLSIPHVRSREVQKDLLERSLLRQLRLDAPRLQVGQQRRIDHTGYLIAAGGAGRHERTQRLLAPLGDDASVDHDDDAIAETLDLFHVMCRVQQCLDTRSEYLEALDDVVLALRIDPDRGLIQDQDLRI